MTSNLSEADRFLLDQIRQGSSAGLRHAEASEAEIASRASAAQAGWQQLVERYQGRLLSFARRKIGACADAEDLVQETFIHLLRGIAQFRGEATLETYMFLILRRRIATWARARGNKMHLLEDLGAGADDDAPPSSYDPASSEPTASWYVRRDEEHASLQDALSAALGEVIAEYKEARDLRDLQIAEMIFYCQLRNKNIAEMVGVRDNHIALVKHRLVARLQQLVTRRLEVSAPLSPTIQRRDFELPDAMLRRVWQESRPSCPKHSTIGAFVLGTLDPVWENYVRFHLDQLECAFCRANYEDIQNSVQPAPPQELRDRILQSTIGFLSRGSSPS